MKKIIILLLLLLNIGGLAILAVSLNKYYEVNEKIEKLKKENLKVQEEVTEIERKVEKIELNLIELKTEKKEKVEVYEKWKIKSQTIENYLK